jgi:hypothetical protein
MVIAPYGMRFSEHELAEAVRAATIEARKRGQKNPAYVEVGLKGKEIKPEKV